MQTVKFVLYIAVWPTFPFELIMPGIMTVIPFPVTTVLKGIM